MYRVCLVFFCQIITRLIPLFLPVFLLLMIRNEMRVVFNDSKNGLFLHTWKMPHDRYTIVQKYTSIARILFATHLNLIIS